MNTPPLNLVQKSLLLLWVSHLLMDFFTGIWPIYKTLAGIDIVQAGLIAGVSGFFGEILQIYFGYLSDRGHRKKMLMLGLVLASAIIWITFVDQIFHSFLLLLLLMLGSGSYHPAAAGIAGGLTKMQKGRYILFFASGGAIGLGISQLTFTSIINVFEGHAYVLIVPVLLVLFALSRHEFPKVEERKDAFSLRNFFAPIIHRKKELLLLYFTQVVTQGLVTSFMFLLPDLLFSRGCHSWLCLGGGHLCFVVGSAMTMVPAGILADKYGQKQVLLTVIFSAILLLYSFLMLPSLNTTSTIVLLSTLGACLGIANPLIISWGNRLVPESPSTVSALLMGFAWCLSNLGPAFAGFLTPLFSENAFAFALGIMGASLLGSFTFISFLPSPVASTPKIPVQNPEKRD